MPAAKLAESSSNEQENSTIEISRHIYHITNHCVGFWGFEGDDDDIIDDDIDDDDGDVDNPDENNDDDNDGVKADDDGLPQRKRPRLPSQLSCYALLPSLVLSINNDNDIYSREHISTIQRIHNEGWEEEKTILFF